MNGTYGRAWGGKTDGSLVEVPRGGDPGEGVAELCERVGETLDVARAVVEKVEAHDGERAVVGGESTSCAETGSIVVTASQGKSEADEKASNLI